MPPSCRALLPSAMVYNLTTVPAVTYSLSFSVSWPHQQHIAISKLSWKALRETVTKQSEFQSVHVGLLINPARHQWQTTSYTMHMKLHSILSLFSLAPNLV
jgi:hypothetical protein